jgi:hypothetical protein
MDCVQQGNGAHAWLFFDAPVAANLARKMVPYLLSSWGPCPGGAAPVARAEEIREQTVEDDKEVLRCLPERKEFMHLRERAR